MKKSDHRLFLGGIVLFLFIFTAADVLAERMAVIGSTANIRRGPGTGHDVRWKVEKYYPIDVIKASGEWYQFRDFEKDTGWIHKSLVKKISTVITKKDKCNVRGGPGTKHDILFNVDSGIPFKVEKRQGQWLQVLHADGDGGWIHNSLVW